jgi:uncharacterized protein
MKLTHGRTWSVPGSLFDSSVWVAATFPTHPLHARAQQALPDATPGDPAVFCRATEQSFLRLASTPALLRAYDAEGQTNRDALAALAALLALPQVTERDERPGTRPLWHRLACRDTASPKVWMDAYLAAFAIRAGLRLLSLDGDFRTFEAEGLNLLLLRA